MVTQQYTTFIGRTQELAEIAALLADPACRLLTLVGPGGIGKTRLAVEATQTLDFPNGVHFVPLQPVADAALLPIAITNAIGIQFFGADEPRIQLLNYLRERQTLLILDNFEHLTDGVDFVVEILNAPGVKLLVTSRTALNIQAEWRYAVGGLNIPENGNEIENFDAVKLFAERARRVRHNFSLSDHPADVIRICQLTEGMPLALELAAGWLKALSCAEIANEIQRGLDFLAADLRDVPERHRSMAAAFSQSWHMLTDDEQKIFRRMSVFRGGFTREAAEQVTGATLQILASLVDKSLLRVDSAGRYDVHELLRQYGEAKLEAAGEIEAIRDTHSGYFLNFLAQRDLDVKGRRQVAALDEIETDLENVRTAWYRGVDQGNAVAINRAIECCTLFFEMRSRVSEHEALYIYAQDKFAPREGQPPELVYANLMLNRVGALISGDKEPSKQALCKALLDESRSILSAYDDPLLTGIMLNNLAGHRLMKGEHGQLELLEQSLSIFRSLGEPYYIAEALNWVAWCYIQTHEYQRSIETVQEFYTLALRTGNQYVAAWGAMFMNLLTDLTGDYSVREGWLYDALHLMQVVRNHFGISQSLYALAEVAFWRGDFEEARRLFDEAIQVGRKFGVQTLCSINCKVSEAHFSIFVEEDYAITGKHFDTPNSNSGYDGLFIVPALCGSGDYEAARKILVEKLRGFQQGRHVDGLHISIIFALLILDSQGKKYWAAQLMGFVSTWHPDVMGLTEKWGLYTRTRTRLEAELGYERYTAAWEQGKDFDLFETAAKILDAWRDLGDSSPYPSPDMLTRRELEVLHLLAAGLSNAQIADKLVITVGTVKGYVHNIYSKFDVKNRTQAVAHARDLDLL